ncbi:ABC transporter permease [Saliphagus infecundisoli]|uniref:ABC transporter permease n=1 Tax=Saliphagus infecundisoli TaxID=1849069 RepID=A0ABD5QAH0_9EURY|nr:ABC transporter permease [Saliphagus infecundisoli]
MSRTEGTDTSPFETISDVETSKSARYREFLWDHVVVPLRIFLKDWRGVVGTVIVGTYVLMGTVGLLIFKKPSPNEGSPNAPPFETMALPLGTDALGQGIFRSLIYATPTMLLMILSGGVFAIAVASMVGITAGYKGGRLDSLLMGVSDMMIALPGLPLVMVVTTIFAPRSAILVGILLAINQWAGLARTLRSQVLTLREESYVEAARVMGAPTYRIIIDDIIPELMPYILISFVNAARAVIFGSVALYFLGVLPFSNFNWGVMMNIANDQGNALVVPAYRHTILFPMLAIVGLSMGLVLIAQAADRLFNVRLRTRHETEK